MNKDDCIFCKIITGEIPSYKIYEDENSFAFLDINPISYGHTLVIPKKHSENITAIDKNDFGLLMETVRFLSLIIKEALDAGSINIKMVGEIVNHTHVHIIPRYPGDNPLDGELDEGAKIKIRQASDMIIKKLQNI